MKHYRKIYRRSKGAVRRNRVLIRGVRATPGQSRKQRRYQHHQSLQGMILTQLGLRPLPRERHWIFLHWVGHLEAPRWHQRVRALHVLATHPIEPLAVPMVVRRALPLLKDPTPWVRVAALDLLGNLRKKDLLPSLLRALADAHHLVRMAAIQAVAKQEPALVESIVMRFFPHLLADPDTFVRVEAMEAIKRLGFVQQYFSHLVPFLHHENSLLQYHAITVLAGVEDPQITQALLTLCQDDDDLVREAAQEAMNTRSTREEGEQ